MSELTEMMQYVKEGFASLGVDFKFGDEKLEGHARGELMTVGQVRGLLNSPNFVEDEAIVWLEFNCGNEPGKSLDQAVNLGKCDGDIMFTFGSFGLELASECFDDKNDDEPFDIWDDGSQFRIFQVTEPKKLTLIDFANSLREASIQIRGIAKRKRISNEDKAKAVKTVLQVCLRDFLTI